MPRYNYKCVQCNEEVEIVHSMSKVATKCPLCESPDSLAKQLTIPRINTTTVPNKAGAIVKRAIEQYKQRIAEEQGAWEDFDVEALLEENKK